MKDKLRLVGRLAGRGGLGFFRVLSWPFYRLKMMAAKAPDRLTIAPQDIHHANPEIATQIYAGYFAFAGKVINTHGHLPFEIAPQDPNWERELTSFGWLGHLRAANSALANANARAIADDFLLHAIKSGPAFEPRVVTRRLLAFLSHAPMILDGADEVFSRRFMRELARAKLLLEHEIACGLGGEDRLFAAIALAEYGICTRSKSGAQRKSTARLVRELDRQILPDGGHISRNPDTLVRLLLDLLPLRQAYVAQAVPVPDPLVNAIDRMLPMLRLLRHGDGTLALFNGMGFIAPERLATLLAYDDVKAQALINAPHSGYQRIECNGNILVIDAGRVPPAEFSTRAHAGCLSIEFSVADQKLIANCGTPDPRHPIARGPARVTAAHSTLAIDDSSSCHFAGSKGLESFFTDEALSGPLRVAIERQPMPKRVRIRLAHDGYVARFGLVHERRLALSNDGLRLDGEDRVRPAAGLAAPPPRPYAVRFHIHPDVRLEGIDERSVLLILPDGRRWIFGTVDVPIAIEESISFATPNGPVPCDQLVIYSETQQKERIAWSLRCLEEQAPSQERAAAEELATQD